MERADIETFRIILDSLNIVLLVILIPTVKFLLSIKIDIEKLKVQIEENTKTLNSVIKERSK